MNLYTFENPQMEEDVIVKRTKKQEGYEIHRVIHVIANDTKQARKRTVRIIQSRPDLDANGYLMEEWLLRDSRQLPSSSNEYWIDDA